MKEIGDHIIQVESIRLVVEKRRTMPWYQSIASYYEGLLQVANMQAFFTEHSAGFHTVEPHRIWREYTSDYYRMDTYYRLFHLCFQRSLKESHPLLDDLFKQVVDKVEGLYTHCSSASWARTGRMPARKTWKSTAISWRCPSRPISMSKRCGPVRIGFL